MPLLTENLTGQVVPMPTTQVMFLFPVSTILSMTSRPSAVGVRFHFSTAYPQEPNDLYLAAVGLRPKQGGSGVQENYDIMDPSGSGADYFTADGASWARAEVNDLINYENSPNPCAFFSISEVLGRPMVNPTSIMLKLMLDDFYENGQHFFTLTAFGTDGNGSPTGPPVKSMQPCPPKCPTDDPIYGNRN